MATFNIRRADMRDKDQIVQHYNDLLDYMTQNINYTYWQKNVYPNEETALEGIRENAMFVLELDGQIAGSCILNNVQPSAYLTVRWSIDASPEDVLVLHTLVVHPKFSGNGVARRLVAFTEKLAKQENLKTIRLDTAKKNVPAIRLYETSGFTFTGDVDLGLAHAKGKLFICYDKIITT